jgi:hypothetical protein
MKTGTQLVFRSLSLVAALSLAALSTGCAAVGVIASAVTPPPEVKAQYEPAKVQTLVLIDPAPGVANPPAVALDADRLARMLCKDLVDHKAVPAVVDNDKLTVFRDSQLDGFRKLSVADVARKLGAEQVIYVELDAIGIGVAQGSDVMKGVAGARVRVVDARTAMVTFPTGESRGQTVAFESEMRRTSDKATAASVRAETLQGLSDRIAKLFYTYRAEEPKPSMLQ